MISWVILVICALVPGGIAHLRGYRGRNRPMRLRGPEAIADFARRRKRDSRKSLLFLGVLTGLAAGLHLLEGLEDWILDVVPAVDFSAPGLLERMMDAGALTLVALPVYTGYVLLISAQYWADRRVRRTTWGFAGYLWAGRSVELMLMGTQALALVLVYATGAKGWWVLAGCGLALALVAALAPGLPRILWRTRPLRAPRLIGRLRTTADRLGMDLPELRVIETGGGKIANAFATGYIPSARAIYVTDHLLRSLRPDEAEAILTHELAHHYHHDLFRFTLAEIGTACLIAAALVVLPGSFRDSVMTSGINWELACIWWVLHTGVIHPFHSRGRERAADRLVVRLVARPRALVSGLDRLHALALLPRDMGRADRLRSTHPTMSEREASIKAEIR